MAITWDKLVSVAVFAVVAVLGATSLNPIYGNLAGVLLAACIALPGMTLIWFAEPLSEQTCFARGTVTATPAFMITTFGWLALVGYPTLLAVVGS